MAARVSRCSSIRSLSRTRSLPRFSGATCRHVSSNALRAAATAMSTSFSVASCTDVMTFSFLSSSQPRSSEIDQQDVRWIDLDTGYDQHGFDFSVMVGHPRTHHLKRLAIDTFPELVVDEPTHRYRQRTWARRALLDPDGGWEWEMVTLTGPLAVQTSPSSESRAPPKSC